MYFRTYVMSRRAGQPEGFGTFTCDTEGCAATHATAFTEADRYPMRVATDSAVAAGWALLGADDRCPAHRPVPAEGAWSDPAVRAAVRQVTMTYGGK